MKKFFVFLMVFILFAAVSCGSSKKSATDDDPVNDEDTDDTEISDEDELYDEEIETDEPDADPVEEGPCSANPCKNIENSTGECIPGENDYSCKCKENYTWEGYAWEGPRCKADERKEKCTGLPENAQWTKVSEVTQTWNGEEWEPSATAVYSEEISYNRCYFKCLPAYFWDGEKCAEPCENEPCKDIPNATGTCFNSTAGRYICECDENYWWWGKRRGCIAQKPALANICTGLYSCCNNGGEIECPAENDEVFYGQDAQYAADGKCKQQSLELKTVSDETIVIDKNTELQWQQTISKKAYNWNDAFAYCENLEYAGFSDWRMPAPQEIMTIVLYSGYSTSIDTAYFTDIPVSGSGNYLWTSAFYKNDPERVWIFHPNKGFTYYLATKSSIYNVMCVRGKGLPAANFEISDVSGDTIAKDSSSGLTWQKTYTEIETWKDALAYCENLEYAGFSDWRLPNKNELASIINYDSDNDSWPLDMPSDYGFWTSTTFFSSSMTNELAIVIEIDGKQGYMPKHNKFYHYPYHVRCVR